MRHCEIAVNCGRAWSLRRKVDMTQHEVTVRTNAPDVSREFTATVRIDTPAEAAHFVHGGILPYVLRQLLDPGT